MGSMRGPQGHTGVCLQFVAVARSTRPGFLVYQHSRVAGPKSAHRQNWEDSHRLEGPKELDIHTAAGERGRKTLYPEPSLYPVVQKQTQTTWKSRDLPLYCTMKLGHD